MGISKVLTDTKQKLKLVFSEDPEVEPSNPKLDCGWIDHKRATVGDKADVVVIRACSMPQRAHIMGSGNSGDIMLAWCFGGIVSVNGLKGQAIETWLAGIESDPIWTYLGYYIRAVSLGNDPEILQLEMFGPDDDDEEDDEDKPKVDDEDD